MFIDDRFVESRKRIARALNPPANGQIVLEPDESEGTHEFQIQTVLDVDSRYLMYYETSWPEPCDEHPSGKCRLTRLASSDDGLHWTRAPVGLIDIGSGKDNNIVMAGAVGTAFLDPNETEGHRFWWIGHMRDNPWWQETHGTLSRGARGSQGGDAIKEGAVYLCHSADGINWKRVKDPILPFGCDTRNQCFFDPRCKKYVSYLRGRPGGHRSRVISRAENDRLIGEWPFDRNPDRPAGPHGFYGHLENELPIVMGTDEVDGPHTGLYTPNVHIYRWAEAAYLAFPEMYRLRDHLESCGRDERGRHPNEGPLDISLAISRDGIAWDRFRTPYVRLGQMGQIDGGTMYMGLGMMLRGDEIWQYSAISPWTHRGFGKKLPGTDGGIRRLVQRLDGFVSVDAGLEGGEITTPPIVFSGSRLQLNVDCSALGELWVEIRDVDGTPVPDYSLEEAISVDMNGTGQEVWWKGGPDVSRLAGRPVQLHLSMRSAKLYAFQFCD